MMMRFFKSLPDSLGRKLERLKWQSALEKSPLFNAAWYLSQNSDVKAAGVNPLSHYLSIGWREMRDPCPEFDGTYYLTRYPDVASLNVPPLVHYWLHGRHEGRHLNPSLDLDWINAEHAQSTPACEDSPSPGNDAPYISVIIPTYNRLRLLPTVIESWRLVNRETPFAYEIIFSDDGSEDGSVEYLEQINDLPIRVLRNDHGGASKARNAAILAAKGERLLIIGDDIFPDAQILNVHARLARTLGKNVATLGVVDWAPDLTVNHLMEHITEIGNEQFSYNRLPDNAFVDFRHFYTCNICIDKDIVVQEKKIFDDRFDQYGFEDIELGYRLSLRGLKIYYTTEAKGDHYHPYIVEGFCKRQICSGRMAVVFRDAHPGVGRILGIDALEAAARQRSGSANAASGKVWQNRLDALIAHCNALEGLIADGGKASRTLVGGYLSLVYSTLFRAMYEYGVLQRITSSEQQVLPLAMERNFPSAWKDYWQHIERTPADALALNREQMHNLLDAHVARDRSILVDPEQQSAMFQELSLLQGLRTIPAADNNRRMRLQRQAGRALYWLVRDPRYLFRRIQESLQRRAGNAPVQPPSTGQRTQSAFALVLDEAHPAANSIRESFTHIMGNEATILSPAEALQTVQREATDNLVLFRPQSGSGIPNRDHLLGAWLAVAENRADLCLISYGLENDGTVTHGNLSDQLVFSAHLLPAVLNGTLGQASFAGKIYRTEPLEKGAWRKSSLNELLCTEVSFNEHNSWFSTKAGPHAQRPYAPAKLPVVEKNRPTVFVFPVFVAVGGVERNTVEIIRKLDSSYDFVVITMERLRQEQGSLAAQFQDAGARLVEMSEITTHSEYLRLLLQLKRWISPDFVWIANGSPWLCDNAQNLRALFHDIPVIDQEVYDVNEGWINRYHEPGIQSFDRFIAINQKIQHKFIEQLNMDREKIDLIYSAVNTQKIIDFKKSDSSPDAVREKLGLPTDRKLFTFVGRLTRQKRPLEFLKLAQLRKDFTDEMYVLVGDGELSSECHAFIARENLNNVKCIPYVANTLELASVTTGLIITSAYEGLPIAMLEVINFGVPVFSTDAGDISVVLEDFAGGQTIAVDASEADRAAAFSHWQERLPEYRRNLQAQEADILDRFSSEHIAKQYIDCFYKASQPYLEQSIP